MRCYKPRKCFRKVFFTNRNSRREGLSLSLDFQESNFGQCTRRTDGLLLHPNVRISVEIRIFPDESKNIQKVCSGIFCREGKFKNRQGLKIIALS